MQNILDERRSEAVFRIAEITGKQSTTMLDLSMKSTWDARSMRTITVVALVYLPPTFVAVSQSLFRKPPHSTFRSSTDGELPPTGILWDELLPDRSHQ